jgi:hypothetical protein
LGHLFCFPRKIVEFPIHFCLVYYRTLSKRPLLAIFVPNLPTELHTDASAIGLGAILFQRHACGLRVVSYYSRRTTPEESRYHSYVLETLAIVSALKYFRVYLVGLELKIVTDCNAIKATAHKKDFVPSVARWWMYLQNFNFYIEYRKGKYVAHVDYLSRNPTAGATQVNVISERSWLEVEQTKDRETLIGRNANVAPVQNSIESLPSTESNINLHSDRLLAYHYIERNATDQKTRFDKTCRNNHKYEAGDYVFIPKSNARAGRLEAQFRGPYKIIEVLPGDRFRVENRRFKRGPLVVPLDHMKRWPGE